MKYTTPPYSYSKQGACEPQYVEVPNFIKLSQKIHLQGERKSTKRMDGISLNYLKKFTKVQEGQTETT